MSPAQDSERAEAEARLQQAITEYQERQKNAPKDSKSSLRRVDKDFNISWYTLKRRLDESLSRNKAQESSMNLSNLEEKELVHWIITLIQHDYVSRYRTVRELMKIIRNQRVSDVNDDNVQLVIYDIFDRDWVCRFISRHFELASVRKKLIEATRIKDVSIKRLTKWFENLHRVINKNDIESENINNMNKSEFFINDIEASQHIINVTIRQAFQAKSERQEWITAIECVYADKTSLSFLIIFKDENLSRQWISANIHNNWRFDYNIKKWTSNIHEFQ